MLAIGLVLLSIAMMALLLTDPNWSRARCNLVGRDGRAGWASGSP
jgi:hypothetical protein